MFRVVLVLAALLLLWDIGGNLGAGPICYVRPYQNADLNCDGNFDVTDVVLAIKLVLGAGIPPEIDLNGDQCPDLCGG